MSIIVTGVAGFIGSQVAAQLIGRGHAVIGLDNLNDYYDPVLKQARLDRLSGHNGFTFRKLDVSDQQQIASLATEFPDVTEIVHLAAQAGVRYSLENPFAYVQTNVMGHLCMMELGRRLGKLRHFVYASSSSVYGGNTELPFSVDQRVDRPVSLYAATKRADELMTHCYAHLFGMPSTGLRFFTVYGPWGRPDMSAFIFTKAILEGRPIRIFNHGDMQRDFTYIDDIVAGVLAVIDHPPQAGAGGPPNRVYNLGNHKSEPLLRFVELIEEACGRPAIREFEDMQPGDVRETYADIEPARRDLGFEPRVSIDEGIPRFVEWYRGYYGA
ncbi:NAD-dependent epimerase/dehydratase family protein [Pelagibius litoralis]|uniref:NAD-dependent epimerase/dehydratase family protein n=1 Tax=Pelagibius litoralis TaxID=374515 RepID=A0A967EXD8_9PROT|nr:NAD-dependent epimerase/dehydratase family protein [Pelagibius litoralis]NIA69035.1 NAD-dependent epimerase/dehydratase family protein [Pelagibius litoralis]